MLRNPKQSVIFTILNFSTFYVLFLLIEQKFSSFSRSTHSQDISLNPMIYLISSILIIYIAQNFKQYKIIRTVLILLIIVGYIAYSNCTLFFIGEAFLVVRILLLVKHIYLGNKFNILAYINYLFYFPIAIAGPYLRPQVFLNDYKKEFYFTKFRISKFIYLVINGGFRVYVVSLVFNIIHTEFRWLFFNQTSLLNFIFSYSFYYLTLYYSFSGISLISSGISLLFGIRVPKNFNRPLSSKNLQEHWSRWHMSFLDLLRENIFIPINIWIYRIRKKTAYFNFVCAIFSIFFVMYIWHGARSRFIIFCLWHAIGLSLHYIYTIIKQNYFKEIELFKIYKFASWLLTFLFLTTGYFFFTESFNTQKNILFTLINWNKP